MTSLFGARCGPMTTRTVRFAGLGVAAAAECQAVGRGKASDFYSCSHRMGLAA
jgi:hypothetical protein